MPAPTEPTPTAAAPVAMLDPLEVAAALPVQAATGSQPSAGAPAPHAAPAAPPPPPPGPPVPWDGVSAPVPGVSTDAAGVPFDEARHLPRTNARTRRWMPRPPRGVAKRRANAAPAGSSPANGASTPAAEVVAPPTIAPGAPAPWTAEEHATAAEGGGAIPPAPGSPEALAQGGAAAPLDPATDAQSSPEANAEVACEVLYTATGLATGVPKEARPSPAEHAAMRRATAAYFTARGWTAVGGWAILIMVVAYLLRVFQKEGSQAKLSAWWDSLTATKGAPPAPPAPPRPVPAARQTIEVGGATPPAPAPHRAPSVGGIDLSGL